MKTASWLFSAGALQARDMFRARFPMIVKQEGARFLFIARMLLAAGLALWISMRLHMEQPSIALNTALVVMNMGSGNVISKSVYRIAGTMGGGCFGVLMYVLFPQERLFVFLGLAVWVTLCTAGAATQRNNQSYCFILAGYTACLIAMPAINAPDSVLMTALLRVAEVFIGLLCCTVVGEALFPSAITNTLQSTVKGRFTVFDEFVSRALSRAIAPEDVEGKQLGFLRDVATLDTYGAFALYEAGSGAHKSRLRLFNAGFMTCSISFYSLHNFMNALPDNTPTRSVFDALCDTLAKVVFPGGKSVTTPDEARDAAFALSQYQKEMQQHVRSCIRETRFTSVQREVLVIGMRLLKRFCEDMRAYFMHFAALDSPVPNRRVQRYFFHPSVDRGIALATGARLALCVLIMAGFWYCAALQDISTPLVFACSIAAFHAGAPNPSRSAMYYFLGGTLGLVCGLIFYLGIVPHTLYFATYFAAAIPFLGIGVYMISTVRFAGTGRAFCFMFGSMVNPGLYYHLDPAQVLSLGVYGLMGVGLAMLLITIVVPPGGRWWKNRMKLGLYRKMLIACTRDLSKSLVSFETGLRDVLLQYTANEKPTAAEKKQMFKRVLVFGQLGRGIIELRDVLRQKRYERSEKLMLQGITPLTTVFFRHPSPAACFSVLDAVRAGMRSAKAELDKETDRMGDGKAGRLRMVLSTLLIFRQSFLEAAKLMPETTDFVTRLDGGEDAA